MIIDLFQLGDSEKDFAFELQPEKIQLGEDSARLNKPVKVEGKVKKGIAQVDVSGRIKGEIELDCSRCLQPQSTILDIPFNVEYVSAEHYTTAKEAELGERDLEVAIYEDGKINLDELAREQILLALPTRFYCKEDCQGLCPKCGENKNLTNCHCEEKEIDPRWQGLRELKIKN
jgi:uncharacterized protein